jgi:hypothetical protein
MTRPWGTSGADKLRDAIARIADAAEAATPLHSTLPQTQAGEVQKLRKYMYIVLGTLTSAKPIAFALSKIPPPVGKQLSTAYQIATATACLTTTTALLSAQGVRSQKNGAAMTNVADRYRQIADAAQAARSLH